MAFFRQIEVTTLIEDAKASGGATVVRNENLIISDFGTSLNSRGEETKICEFNPSSGILNLLGDDLAGASGAVFP